MTQAAHWISLIRNLRGFLESAKELAKLPEQQGSWEREYWSKRIAVLEKAIVVLEMHSPREALASTTGNSCTLTYAGDPTERKST